MVLIVLNGSSSCVCWFGTSLLHGHVHIVNFNGLTVTVFDGSSSCVRWLGTSGHVHMVMDSHGKRC